MQATSARKHCCPRMHCCSISTEYRERFLPPQCRSSILSTSTKRDPYHQLKGASDEMSNLRSIRVTRKCAQPPPKAPQPSVSPQYIRKCSSVTQNPLRFAEDQTEPKVENYTSVYKNDFQAWKVKKRLPYKLSDSLTVNQGLVVTHHPSKGRFQKDSVQVAAPQMQKPQPFESVTSYRSDYVPYLVQTIRRLKPVHHTQDLLTEFAAPPKPKAAWEANQDISDEASAFFQKFKNWSLENNYHGGSRASGGPADGRDFLSTTRADDECQCAQPVRSSEPTRETSKERLCGPTTMKEDFRSWGMPRRFPAVREEELDWTGPNGGMCEECEADG